MHRDLKSGNLLVSQSLSIKIADFGTAALTGDHSSRKNVPDPAGIRTKATKIKDTDIDEETLLEPNAVLDKHTTRVGTLLWMAPELLSVLLGNQVCILRALILCPCHD